MKTERIIVVVRDERIPVAIELPDEYVLPEGMSIQVGFSGRFAAGAKVPATREEVEPAIQATFTAITKALQDLQQR